MLAATSAEYKTSTMEAALRRMFKDVSYTDKVTPARPVHRSFGRKGSKGRGKGKVYNKKISGTNVADDDDGKEDEVDNDGSAASGFDDAFYEGEGDGSITDDGEDDEAHEEAMAAFQTAKKKLAAVRQGRQRGYKGGKNKGGDLDEKKKTQNVLTASRPDIGREIPSVRK